MKMASLLIPVSKDVYKRQTKVFAELKYTKKHLVIKYLAFCSLVDIQYYICLLYTSSFVRGYRST